MKLKYRKKIHKNREEFEGGLGEEYIPLINYKHTIWDCLNYG